MKKKITLLKATILTLGLLLCTGTMLTAQINHYTNIGTVTGSSNGLNHTYLGILLNYNGTTSNIVNSNPSYGTTNISVQLTAGGSTSTHRTYLGGIMSNHCSNNYTFGNTVSASSTFNSNNVVLNWNPTRDGLLHTRSGTSYQGIRFLVNGNYHYGWVRYSWEVRYQDPTFPYGQISILEMAVNTAVDGHITIGQTTVSSPTVTTQAVSSIGTTSAMGNGNITAIGTSPVIQHGHVWSTSTNPTTSNSKTTLGSKNTTGAYTSSITGLTAGTTYYVRAYATSSVGTTYGEDISFTTKKVFTVDDISGSYTYNGSAQEPLPVVKDGETVLVKDTDYTLSYSDNINAGDATVTVTGAGDYSGVQEKEFTITAKELTITGIAIANKVYDGGLDVTITVAASLVGVETGDVVTIDATNATAAFADANVADGIAVTVSGYALDGADKDNYTLTQPTGLTADITAKELTIRGSFTAHDKAHDGTTDAEIKENNLTLEGKVEGENVVLVSIVGQFASPDIAHDVLVSIVSAELDGADKGNYTLSLTGAPTTTASITTTTGIETGTLAGTGLYPNPFSDHINIKNVQSVDRVVVTNIMGQQVINTKLNGVNTINTSHLGSGVFIVTLHLVNGQLAQHRMVKR